MTVRFLEVARGELDEAIAYYNSQVPGLGDAYLLEAIAAIERIRGFLRPGSRWANKCDAAGCGGSLTD